MADQAPRQPRTEGFDVGTVVGVGTLETLATNPASHTGRYLARMLTQTAP